MVTELTKDNFESEVMKSDIPVLIDYWASWCMPCSMVSPIIDEISEEYSSKLKVCKVNIDEQGELASRAAVVSIPTIMLVKNGKTEEKLVGAYSKDDYEEIIEKYI
ncbi:MAG: thioredoxin [Oscillospiraceae bacterium]|nr:thioredoxin [Oscillospiraceae bacterium]